MPEEKLLALNRAAVQLLKDIRTNLTVPIVVSGTMGPLQDAYEDSTDAISLDAAHDGYREQIRSLAAEGLTKETGLPAIVSFSIESDGNILGGCTLESAIRRVDEATDRYATYFGVNCAHPLRIVSALQNMSIEVRERIGMVRGNASLRAHEELDNSQTLDRGDISVYIDGLEKALEYLPRIRAIGGCCGTDEEHLQAIANKFMHS
ncbi:Homocysteine S-methyltransferase [Aspergillus ambiguus]|uniref:Homocysteine S-methyltransferase n=1 Tax=Aspergillus ambiguus TaxID=176160 RepID=UPI003CCCFF54